ncbi:MAG TPA: hypothetical protein VE981_10205 [Planctomycetota bacterium]|nr:hypothetical protein [Planctomycetota bacterium]
MTNPYHRNRALTRAAGLTLVALFLGLGTRTAPAYFPIKTPGGISSGWRAGSDPGIFANNTIGWEFFSGNYPIGNVPPVDESGAAFQNALESHNDVLGDTISFVRRSNTTVSPGMRDGRLTMAWVTNQAADFYGTDLTGANGVTYVDYDTATGLMQDGDMFLNGDPNRPPGGWSTTLANGWNDPTATATHEGMHVLGAGHTAYFGARVFPVARSPFNMTQDRCLSPDDKAYHRDIYTGTTLQGGRITGVVNLSGGGTCNKAVVVATDASGVPQAITATAANGTYSVAVPAGTYSMTVFNGWNSEYRPTSSTDLDFQAAPVSSDFISASTVTGVVVADGGNNAAAAIVATNPAGVLPCLWLRRQSLSPLNPQFQAVFVTPGSTGTILLQIDNERNTANPVLATNQISGVTVGAGTAGDITVAAASWTASLGPTLSGRQTTIVSVPYTVPAAAIPGWRNLLVQLNINNNERLFLPGIIKVLGTGGLVVSTPAAGNPVVGNHAAASTNVPLLRVQMQALAPAAPAVNNEDIRLRRLVFNIAGTGPALPAVRLWVDGQTAGVVDVGVDPRVFSGAAYVNNPIDETIPGTPGGTVTFDNIALTVPSGGTINLLLTADFPAAGTGDYTASFNPADAASITSHGMFWGDIVTPSGTTVTGGTQNLGALSIAGLVQVRTTGGANIPVGGFTPELQVTCRGTCTAATGTVGMEAEVKPLGTAFDGLGTFSSATTFASGTAVSVNVTGLINLTSYHWRARAISATLPASNWAIFGNNAESAVDFSVDNSTNGPPTGLAQLEIDGTTPVPIGGMVRGAIIFSGNNGTNSLGNPVRLEVEVQPTGTAFANAPSVASVFGPSGAAATMLFSGAPTSDYHWQARTVDNFGVASTWVNFNAAAIHFHMEKIQEIKADAGCIGAASVFRGPMWMVWGAAGLALLLVFGRRRKAAGTLGAILILLALPAVVRAEEDVLPRSLADPSPDLSLATEPVPEPAMKEVIKSWGSLDAYLGVLFMDFKFDALGTDFVRREVNGTGTAVIGLEGLIDLDPDWRVGVAVEAGLWSDIRIIAGGPMVAWRFAGSHKNAVNGLSDNEHYLKLGLFYEKLTVSKSNFGSFDATFGVRLGYEMRLSLGERWSVTIGGALQYSQWDYSPSVLSGDDKIGGFGGLISLGFAWLP